MNRSHPTTSPADRRIIGPRRTAGGFTLIELLVVVGIIALLLGLLVSAVIRGRLVAEQGATKQFMNSIALAVKNYARDVGEVPPYAKGDGTDGIDDSGEQMARSKELYQAIALGFRHQGRAYPAYITPSERQAKEDGGDLYFTDQWQGVIDYRFDPDPDALETDGEFPDDFLEDNRVSLNAAPFLLHSPGPDGNFGGDDGDDDILVIGE